VKEAADDILTPLYVLELNTRREIQRITNQSLLFGFLMGFVWAFLKRERCEIYCKSSEF
jgi:hypothetical protein